MNAHDIFSAEPVRSQDDVLVPVSFYDSTWDNGEHGYYRGINRPLLWRSEFVKILKKSKDRHYAMKDQVPLYCPTTMLGTRGLNAATTSSLLIIDSDGGPDIKEVVQIARDAGMECVIHTTGSNRIGDRFRIIVPVTEALDIKTQMRAGRALVHFFSDLLGNSADWEVDTGKLNPYSMCYLPAKCRYVKCANDAPKTPEQEALCWQFYHIEGAVQSATDLLSAYPQPEEPPPIDYKAVFAATNSYTTEDAAAIPEMFLRQIVAGNTRVRNGWHQGIVCPGCRKPKGAFMVVDDGWRYKCWVADCEWVEPGTGWSPGRPLGQREKKLYSDFGGDVADLPQKQKFEDSDFVRMQTEDYYEMIRQEQELEQVRVPNGFDHEFAEEVEEVEPEEPAAGADLVPAPGPADEQEIHNFFGSLVSMPELTKDMLPDVLADFIWDETERMGILPDAPALATLVVVSGAISDNFVVNPKLHDDGWPESARLWGLVIGDPGSKKTPACNVALAPLRAVEREWRKVDKEAMEQYKEDLDEYQVIKSGKDKGGKGKNGNDDFDYEPEKPEKPRLRRLIINEFTMEALPPVLMDNPEGVLVFQDEIIEVLGSFDCYKSSKGKDRASALRFWNGGEWNWDRVKNADDPWIIPNWSAGFLGGVQPDKLGKIAATLYDDGFLQRFLVAPAESIGIGIDRPRDLAAIERYHSLISDLTSRRPPDIVKIRVSADAYKYVHRILVLAEAIKNAPTTCPALKGHADKVAGLFARLMLVLHMIECVHEIDQDRLRLVAEKPAAQAYRLMVRWLLPNAVKMYEQYFERDNQARQDVLAICNHILYHKLTALTLRDLDRKGPGSLREAGSKQRRNAAIEELVCGGWLTAIPSKQQQTGRGRPRNDAVDTWQVNLAVHGHFAKQAELEREHRETMRLKRLRSNRVLDGEYPRD